MGDAGDDARFPPKHCSLNSHSSFGSSRRARQPNGNPSYPRSGRNLYGGDVEDDEEDEENAQEEDDFEDNDEGINGGYDYDRDGDEDDYGENGYNRVGESQDSGRHKKKRKLESLGSRGYEFAPRAAANRLNPSADWTDQATSVLLEVWGDRFVRLGRRSLRSDDWHEVAEKVSEGIKEEKTDIQCRNRLDTLKKRYKKEKEKSDKFGGNTSKWAYFKKLDMLLGSSPRQQQQGLSCGVDSGEYVFMNTKVYLDRSNGFDEMRDSPDNSESFDGNEDDSDGLPPRRSSSGGGDDGGDSSFALLADSIQKFGEIYEKIENSKRQQMMDLEKMRMDFHRDLELQKKQMLERAHAEIAKMQQEDDGDTDTSAENLSG